MDAWYNTFWMLLMEAVFHATRLCYGHSADSTTAAFTAATSSAPLALPWRGTANAQPSTPGPYCMHHLMRDIVWSLVHLNQLDVDRTGASCGIGNALHLAIALYEDSLRCPRPWVHLGLSRSAGVQLRDITTAAACADVALKLQDDFAMSGAACVIQYMCGVMRIDLQGQTKQSLAHRIVECQCSVLKRNRLLSLQDQAERIE